jgi:hypothetical protein
VGRVARSGSVVQALAAPDLQQLSCGIAELKSLTRTADLHGLHPVATVGRPGGREANPDPISGLNTIGAGAPFPEQKLYLLALTRPDPQSVQLAFVGGPCPLHDLDDLTLDFRRWLLRRNRETGGQHQADSDGVQPSCSSHGRLLS